MGCGGSKPSLDGNEMAKSEMTMKAALLIQNWYRRYLARLEARRRYTWSIFQSLEYAGEQDQLRLYNFFNDMMTHMKAIKTPGKDVPQQASMLSAISSFQRPVSRVDSRMEEDIQLMKITDPSNILVSAAYKGPHLSFPISSNQVEAMIDAFKKKEILHAKYVIELLHEARRVMKKMGNIHRASTIAGKQITVCGDLHGKLEDLLIIFYKNGLPDVDNPYVFNGDFVDRGHYSVEISMLLFAFVILTPNSVFINRGNHEDHVMNLRYGFIKEIMGKYKEHATKIIRLFEDTFSWLPLATVIDGKILVCHGGISDKTDLEFLDTIDRHKYLSALRPPIDYEVDDEDESNLMEWRQVLDILWSDPRCQNGCSPNTFRGGGSYFGPDVTTDVLDKHGFQLLIRSHECKEEGYQFEHNDKVLTIFSASNYYEEGSNKGAYIKLGPDLHPHIVQYMVNKRSGRKLTIKQRVNKVEASALSSLRSKIFACKTLLLLEFEKYDPANMGLIKLADWCRVMTKVLKMDLPWRSLRPSLCQVSNNGMLEYHSTFENFKLLTTLSDDDSSSVTEVLYRNKESLETIFRAMDKDNSGYISLSELEEACNLLNRHTKTYMSREDIIAMAKNMDMNKDGYIDFNEFLEAFRIVDQFGRELSRRRSDEEGERQRLMSGSTDQTYLNESLEDKD